VTDVIPNRRRTRILQGALTIAILAVSVILTLHGRAVDRGERRKWYEATAPRRLELLADNPSKAVLKCLWENNRHGLIQTLGGPSVVTPDGVYVYDVVVSGYTNVKCEIYFDKDGKISHVSTSRSSSSK
jgi:hypothetical protein